MVKTRIIPGYTKEYFESAYSAKELEKMDESSLATAYLIFGSQRGKYIDKYRHNKEAPRKTENSKRADLLFEAQERAENVLRNKWGYKDEDFETLRGEKWLYI